MYYIFREIIKKMKAQKIDDRMKLNHEFNYCNLDYLIICRIDDVWLLNLFLFEITICFRFSCHDDVNDSNHYSESFYLDEDFADTLTTLIIIIKKPE